jgi:hypothetical protein
MANMQKNLLGNKRTSTPIRELLNPGRGNLYIWKPLNPEKNQ